MNRISCTCCRNMSDGDKGRENFYRDHFIPRKWKLEYYFGLSGGVRLLLTVYCRDCYGDLEEPVSIPEGLTGDSLLSGLYNVVQSAHPYDTFAEATGYYGACEERSNFYCLRDKQTQFKRNIAFLDLFHDYDCAQVRRWLEHTFPTQSRNEVLRDTAGDLFCTVVRMATEAGDMEKADAILDYILPREREAELHEGIKLTSYEFDFVPIINFGNSEGIYIDCYLKGTFDESGKHSIHIGTLKTLRTDLEACKIMGELCGALMFHEHKYVNQNIRRYTPDKFLEGQSD